jgi:hypothetical protein
MLRNARPDGLDNARAFMSQQKREPVCAIRAALDAKIGVANARCQNTNNYFIWTGVVDCEFFD